MQKPDSLCHRIAAECPADASLPALGRPSADGRASHDSGGSSSGSAGSPAAARALLLALRESATPAGAAAAAGGPVAAAEEAAAQLRALLAGLQAPVDVAIVAQVRRRGLSGQSTLPLRWTQCCPDGTLEIGTDLID